MRLVDGDGLKKQLLLEGDLGHVNTLEDVNKIIDFVPTVDAMPVVHGKWVSVDGDVIFSCSNCENEVSTSWDYDADTMFTYCPCCGAKMDGEAR